MNRFNNKMYEEKYIQKVIGENMIEDNLLINLNA